VARAVVHHHDLEILEALVQHGRQRAFQKMGAVVNRNNDGKCRAHQAASRMFFSMDSTSRNETHAAPSLSSQSDSNTLWNTTNTKIANNRLLISSLSPSAFKNLNAGQTINAAIASTNPIPPMVTSSCR